MDVKRSDTVRYTVVKTMRRKRGDLTYKFKVVKDNRNVKDNHNRRL